MGSLPRFINPHNHDHLINKLVKSGTWHFDGQADQDVESWIDIFWDPKRKTGSPKGTTAITAPARQRLQQLNTTSSVSGLPPKIQLSGLYFQREYGISLG